MQMNRTVFMAKSVADLFSNLKSVDNLQILGGCTQVQDIAEKSVTIRAIAELSHIEKKERYLELGPAVTLSQLLALGRTNMPSVLYDALAGIATEGIRNLATLGGNICASIRPGATPAQKMTLWAPLLALGASLEIKKSSPSKMKNGGELRTVTETRLLSQLAAIPEKAILSRIKVPLNEWEIALFRRVGPAHVITPNSASFVFLADTQKDIIANIRIIFAGTIVFHSKELEDKIIGTRLPLSPQRIAAFMAEAEAAYEQEFSGQNIPPILKAQLLNLLGYSFGQLA